MVGTSRKQRGFMLLGISLVGLILACVFVAVAILAPEAAQRQRDMDVVNRDCIGLAFQGHPCTDDDKLRLLKLQQLLRER